jgi:lantibiotic modifying enzyme
LYSGTAGIAVFLASLAAVTRDQRQRTAAIGAMRRAVALARRRQMPVGGYSGLAGVLYAAAAVAEALQCDEFATRTVPSLIAKLAASRPDDRALDIIDGRAGAVRSLLIAADGGLGREGLALTTAVRFGREIIDLAQRRDDQWSWATTWSPTTGHLLGYSHGTAGIAGALGDLFLATGEREFQRGALGAWKYEASRFNPIEQNWPDYRVASRVARSHQPRAVQYGSAWCHGAAGSALALARHLAANPGGSPELKTVLAKSVQTTIASLRAPRRDAQDVSFCLCHGLAGNADIVLQIEQLAGRTAPHPAVLEAAEAGVDRHHDAGTWPCGVSDGNETPGLLLGLAGIGHFYLRLHDPSVPSPLLL